MRLIQWTKSSSWTKLTVYGDATSYEIPSKIWSSSEVENPLEWPLSWWVNCTWQLYKYAKKFKIRPHGMSVWRSQQLHESVLCQNHLFWRQGHAKTSIWRYPELPENVMYQNHVITIPHDCLCMSSSQFSVGSRMPTVPQKQWRINFMRIILYLAK
jgi:hypothetical protein